jgi:hypothetical protein
VPSEWGRLVVCSTRSSLLHLCCRGGGCEQELKVLSGVALQCNKHAPATRHRRYFLFHQKVVIVHHMRKVGANLTVSCSRFWNDFLMQHQKIFKKSSELAETRRILNSVTNHIASIGAKCNIPDVNLMPRPKSIGLRPWHQIDVGNAAFCSNRRNTICDRIQNPDPEPGLEASGNTNQHIE